MLSQAKLGDGEMSLLPERGLWVVGPVRNPQASQREVRVAAGLAQHSNVSVNLMDAAPAIRHIFFTGGSLPVLRLHRLCLASSSFNRTRPLASATSASTAAWTWGGSSAF